MTQFSKSTKLISFGIKAVESGSEVQAEEKKVSSKLAEKSIDFSKDLANEFGIETLLKSIFEAPISIVSEIIKSLLEVSFIFVVAHSVIIIAVFLVSVIISFTSVKLYHKYHGKRR
jgi:hypothetical protein